MKKSLLFKNFFLLFIFLLVCDTYVFGQSGQSIAQTIHTFYTTYIRPILIAWVVIQLGIGGIMANQKIQKHTDESSDAMMGFFKMAIWPVVVLAIAELAMTMYG